MIERASANHIYAQSLIDNGDKHYNRSALYERNTPAALLHKQEFAYIRVTRYIHFKTVIVPNYI